MTIARLVASVGGAGFLPRVPGTWGSLIGMLAGWGVLAAGGRWALAGATLLATGIGLWAIPRAGGGDDPGWVVIDEIAGMWLTMLPLRRPTPVNLLAAFTLFRFLDISKPGPIGDIDRVRGRAGVMGDDLAAGTAAAVLLWIGLRAAGR